MHIDKTVLNLSLFVFGFVFMVLGAFVYSLYIHDINNIKNEKEKCIMTSDKLIEMINRDLYCGKSIDSFKKSEFWEDDIDKYNFSTLVFCDMKGSCIELLDKRCIPKWQYTLKNLIKE